MLSILFLLLKVFFYSAVPLSYYFLFLRPKKLYSFNRIYLLSIVPVSVLLPFVNPDWIPVKYSAAVQYKLVEAIVTNRFEPEYISRDHSVNWYALLPVAYFLISLLLLIKLFYSIRALHKIKTTYPHRTGSEGKIIMTDMPKAPFSFLSTIFWRVDLDENTEPGRSVMQHELAHIRLKHSIDKLFMQGVIILGWINPCYWLIEKELSLQHEFAADEEGAHGDIRTLSLMLLYTHFKPGSFSIVHSFFHSSIKKRLKMINSSSKINHSLLRKLLIAPVMFCALLLFSYRSPQQNGTIVRSAKNIRVILDAGHGGSDDGAVERSTVREKDFSLLIAKQIMSLAPEYNITILPTRSDDEFIDPRARLIKSEKLDGELFVSVHMDMNGKNAGPAAGYSMVISPENGHFESCRELASAMISRMASNGLPFSLVESSKVWVLRKNSRPAVLLECGNINNPADVERINNPDSRERLARDILTGIVDYTSSAGH